MTTERTEEHREIARRMPEEFTMAQFRRLYVGMYPKRPLNSIMSYEYTSRPRLTGQSFLRG